MSAETKGLHVVIQILVLASTPCSALGREFATIATRSLYYRAKYRRIQIVDFSRGPIPIAVDQGKSGANDVE